jgi:hypothetical protein
MTDKVEIAFAYAKYVQARINRVTTDENERAILNRMLDAALEDAVSVLFSEGALNG